MINELVILMGYNAAGKSTVSNDYTDNGFIRLNRDLIGGTLGQLVEDAHRLIEVNQGRRDCGIIFDNTYPSIKSRAPIIALGKKHGIPVRCLHLNTSLEDAQLNACLRMIRKTGKLYCPEDYKGNTDPNIFPPAAIYHYRKEFQAPSVKEGFAKVEEIPFKRVWAPEYKNKALILDYDGTLRLSTGKQKYPVNVSDIKMLPNRKEKILEFKKNGYVLLGASNQSGIDKGSVPREAVVICFEETNRLLGIDIDYQFCPHRVPPISCYCRKPAPGIGAWFIEKYKLNPADCIMIGDMTSDKTFAQRCGFQFQFADKFFK